MGDSFDITAVFHGMIRYGFDVFQQDAFPAEGSRNADRPYEFRCNRFGGIHHTADADTEAYLFVPAQRSGFSDGRQQRICLYPVEFDEKVNS